MLGCPVQHHQHLRCIVRALDPALVGHLKEHGVVATDLLQALEDLGANTVSLSPTSWSLPLSPAVPACSESQPLFALILKTVYSTTVLSLPVLRTLPAPSSAWPPATSSYWCA